MREERHKYIGSICVQDRACKEKKHQSCCASLSLQWLRNDRISTKFEKSIEVLKVVKYL